MISPDLIPQILSNLCQVTATSLSIYIAIFIFFWGYLSNNELKIKLNSKMKIFVICSMIVLGALLLYLNKLFIFPSIELGIISYIPFIFITIYMLILVYLFIIKESVSVLEKGLLVFSFILTVCAMVLGGFIIFSGMSAMPSSYTGVTQDYIYYLTKYSRLFFLTILNSIISMVFFVSLHKFIGFNKRKT